MIPHQISLAHVRSSAWLFLLELICPCSFSSAWALFCWAEKLSLLTFWAPRPAFLEPVWFTAKHTHTRSYDCLSLISVSFTGLHIKLTAFLAALAFFLKSDDGSVRVSVWKWINLFSFILSLYTTYSLNHSVCYLKRRAERRSGLLKRQLLIKAAVRLVQYITHHACVWSYRYYSCPELLNPAAAGWRSAEKKISHSGRSGIKHTAHKNT